MTTITDKLAAALRECVAAHDTATPGGEQGARTDAISDAAVAAKAALTEYDAQQSQVNRMAQALRPFTALLQDHNDRGHNNKQRPDAQPIFAINDAMITLGDLRRAVEALAACDTATPAQSKPGDTKPLSELQDDRYTLVTQPRNVRAVVDHFDDATLFAVDLDGDDVSGAIVDVWDGDFREVWMTEHSRPFYLDTPFKRVA